MNNNGAHMSENLLVHKPSFAKATQPFIQRGQLPPKDLLPIIPPGAALSPKSAVDNSQVGKVPGRYDFRSNIWFGLTGAWPTMGLPDNLLHASQSWPTDNVGLRAENWPAVDIDVASEEARDLVEGLANFHLGHAPVRVRAGAPRALMVFRKVGEEPIRKMRLVFEDGTNVHAVEILGAGQQYLINGIHPSGVPYEWREGADLATWSADSLIKITAQDVRNFMDVLVGEITARGWKITTDIRLRPSVGGAGHAVKDLEPIVSVETALDALRMIPNDEDTLPMREDLVGVLAAFCAAAGRDSQRPEIVTEVTQWATAHDWADAEYVAGVLRSLTHVRVGPERLFGMARKYGFIGDAQEDFKDSVAAAEEKIVVSQSALDEDAERLEALTKRVVYWPAAKRWIDKESKIQYDVSAFNQAPHLGVMIAPTGATGIKTASNLLLNSSRAQTVSGMTYLPGQPQMVTWEFNGVSNFFFNKWTARDVPVFVATDDDIRPWLDHVEYLFENVEDREYLLDFLAHVAQYRGRKIRWAPIIIGNQGVGKDLFLRPIVKGLGERTNAQTVQPERLNGNFIDFWEKELVIVEEVSRTDRTDIYERMKAVIAGTVSDTVTIERKFEQPYEVPNVVNLIFFSNHSDALNLSADDRRFFVMHSYAEPRDHDYYEHLSQTFYEKQLGWQKVFNWLRKRNIAHFNPDARPRFNEAKQRMIEESQPYYTLWMRDTYLAGRSVVVIKDILDQISTDFNFPARIRDTMRSQAQVSKALKFAGWHYREKMVRLGDKSNSQNVWCRTKVLAEGDAEMIRARYQAEKEKKLSNVG